MTVITPLPSTLLDALLLAAEAPKKASAGSSKQLAKAVPGLPSHAPQFPGLLNLLLCPEGEDEDAAPPDHVPDLNPLYNVPIPLPVPPLVQTPAPQVTPAETATLGAAPHAEAKLRPDEVPPVQASLPDREVSAITAFLPVPEPALPESSSLPNSGSQAAAEPPAVRDALPQLPSPSPAVAVVPSVPANADHDGKVSPSALPPLLEQGSVAASRPSTGETFAMRPPAGNEAQVSRNADPQKPTGIPSVAPAGDATLDPPTATKGDASPSASSQPLETPAVTTSAPPAPDTAPSIVPTPPEDSSPTSVPQARRFAAGEQPAPIPRQRVAERYEDTRPDVDRTPLEPAATVPRLAADAGPLPASRSAGTEEPAPVSPLLDPSADRTFKVAFAARLVPADNTPSANSDAHDQKPPSKQSEATRPEVEQPEFQQTGAPEKGSDKRLPAKDSAAAFTQESVPRLKREPEAASPDTPPLRIASPSPPGESPAFRGSTLAPDRLRPDPPPQPAAPLEAIRRPEAPAEESRPSAPVRDLHFQVNYGEQRVDVRLADRGGDVLLAVRTPDSQLANTLRERLPQLSSRLEQSGFQAETWQPAESSEHRHRTAQPQSTQTPQDQQNPSQHGRQEQHQPPRQSKVPAKSSSNFRKELSWLLSNSR